MNVLILDTSTPTGSVALQWQGRCYAQQLDMPRQHNQQLLPTIKKLLAEAGIQCAQLDAIAFGRGPGSFVGVRLAASVTQGLAYAANLPVIALSSLQILAQTLYQQEEVTQVHVGVDAHMNTLYYGYYELHAGIMQLLKGESAVAPQAIPNIRPGRAVAIGNAWQVYEISLPPQVILHPNANSLSPQAAAAIPLAAFYYQQGALLTPDQALPVYLQETSLWQKMPQK